MRFLVDAMLGNVVRDLRLLGFDAAYAGTAADPEVLRRCQAEGRILVTRDRALAARARAISTVLVTTSETQEQTAAVLRHLRAAHPLEARPLTRCLACNGRLRDATAASVHDRVPDHVALTHRHFRECPECGRVYWSGGHRARLDRRLDRLLGTLQGRGRQV